VGQVLLQTLAGTDLALRELDGQLLITIGTQTKDREYTMRYDLADLAESDPRRVEGLAKWVKQLIRYGSWEGQTETPEAFSGKCQPDGLALVVTHRAGVHFQVQTLCDRLRLIRGLPTRHGIDNEQLILGGRSSHFTAMQQPISARMWRDTSLHQVVAKIESQLPVRILIDWPSLYEAGWSPGQPMKFFCHEQPLREALARLLEPMGLTVRIIDSRTLQITTPAALAARHDVEFYPLGADITTAQVQQLSRQIVKELGADRFQPQGRGALAYDPRGQCLIVALPQHQQEQVQARLAQATLASGRAAALGASKPAY
jgi:hypothetical protein